GKADTIDLDRRRPQREDPFPGVERVAVAIDEDGDAVLANALRDAGDRFLTDVGEMLERGPRPALEWIVVVGAQAVGEHLQPRPVDLLPELQRKMHGRVFTHVPRREGYPQ